LTEVVPVLNLKSRYELTAGVRFRSEDFGGIVYKRENDQLIFLNSYLAIEILTMAGQGTVQDIVPVIQSVVAQDREKQVLSILSSLKEMGIIYELAE
jgi:putative mycofactocin binding protein MftB